MCVLSLVESIESYFSFCWEGNRLLLKMSSRNNSSLLILVVSWAENCPVITQFQVNIHILNHIFHDGGFYFTVSHAVLCVLHLKLQVYFLHCCTPEILILKPLPLVIIINCFTLYSILIFLVRPLGLVLWQILNSPQCIYSMCCEWLCLVTYVLIKPSRLI